MSRIDTINNTDIIRTLNPISIKGKCVVRHLTTILGNNFTEFHYLDENKILDDFKELDHHFYFYKGYNFTKKKIFRFRLYQIVSP